MTNASPVLRHSDSIYVAHYWNGSAPSFDAIYTGDKSPLGRTLDLWFRKDIWQRFDWTMEKAGDVNGLRVCDIGCGSGRFVAEFGRRGAHVTGVDIAPNMLAKANTLVREAGVSHLCDFVNADILDFEPAQQYDLSIAIGFWDYVQNPASRLLKIRELTTGKFLSAWPRFWTWRMPIRKVRLQCIEGCPVHFWTEGQVRRMIEAAGFKISGFDTIGKLFCVEAETV